MMKKTMNFTGRIAKPPRTPKACDNCRRRKIKCSTISPCLNCVASALKCVHSQEPKRLNTSFFESPFKLNHDLSSLKDSLAGLSNRLLSANSQEVKNHIKGAILALEKVEKVDLESITQIQYDAIESYTGTHSIETAMVSKPHLFDRFPIGTNSNVDPPLNAHFGIYTPLVYFTSIGISHLMTKLLQIQDYRGTRETMYLHLKFLDLSSEIYMSLEPELGQDSKISSQFEDLLCMLPCNVENEIFQFRKKPMRKCSDMLHSCSHIQHCLQKAFCQPILKSTLIESYIKAVEKLATLCCKAFGLSVLTGPGRSPSPDILIEIIDEMYWVFDSKSAGMLIALACRSLLDSGYGRWEYNVGINEKSADNKRKIWWKCFWWDRWSAMSTGKPPILSEETSNCPFPREVMCLKVDDEMDCLALAEGVDLKASNLEGCLSFGYILLAKTISFAFSSMLYSQEFTAYRRYSSDVWRNPDQTLTKLKRHHDQLVETFRLVDIKLTPIVQSNLQEQRCHRLYMFIKTTSVFISQELCSLFTRLQKCLPNKEASLVSDLMRRSAQHLFENSEDALLNVLKLEDFKALIEHGKTIYIFMLNMASQMVANWELAELSSDKFLFNISLMCGICDRLKDLGNSSNMRHRSVLGNVACFITARMCCQAYMGSQGKTEEQLFMDLEEFGAQIIDVARNVMDSKSSLYAVLSASGKQSPFTQSILKYTKMKSEEIRLHSDDEMKSQSGHIDQTPNILSALPDPTNSPVVDTELDFFASTDSSNLLAMFWHEMTGLDLDHNNMQL